MTTPNKDYANTPRTGITHKQDTKVLYRLSDKNGVVDSWATIFHSRAVAMQKRMTRTVPTLAPYTIVATITTTNTRTEERIVTEEVKPNN